MADLSEFAYGTDCPQAASAGAGVAAPTAGTAIATLASTSLPAGTYDITVVTRNAPGAAADEPSTNENNMELRIGAAVKMNRLNSTKRAGAEYEMTDVILDGSSALSVNATANATASTLYKALIVAVRNG